MFKINTPAELLSSFRPEERAAVELPEDIRFPLVVRDYLAWTETSGSRVFLLFADADPRKPLGVVFKREASSGGAVAQMCEWCHTTSGGDGVTLLTAWASSRRRVGVQVCRDLSCAQKVLGLYGPAHAGEQRVGPDGRERIRQIMRRMSEFSRRHLF
ncbi:MAG: FBP domain-containing protein [Oligoflexia bacterium]|nr:FBP domain-containing protein [Oligoflexia bacterium]